MSDIKQYLAAIALALSELVSDVVSFITGGDDDDFRGGGMVGYA